MYILLMDEPELPRNTHQSLSTQFSRPLGANWNVMENYTHFHMAQYPMLDL